MTTKTMIAFGMILVVAGCTAQASEGGASPSSSSGAGGNGNGGGGASAAPVATGDCIDRCADVLGACGATHDQASQACVEECAPSSKTEDQLACLEAASCGALFESASPFSGCDRASSSSSDGSSGGANAKPTALTITGSFGSTKAIHVNGSGGEVHSTISLSPAPKFSPQAPSEVPKLADASYTVESPALGSCDADLRFTLSATQVGVVVTGSDELPSIACTKFTDAIASKGLKVKFKSADYPNGGSATVTVNLTP